MAAVSNGKLFFDFDPARALFTKEGDALVIHPVAGAPTIVESFFAPSHGDIGIEFVLPDGTALSGKDFFNTYSPELVTAMGPVASPPSGGGGDYNDAAGHLIGGVDRFAVGAAGTDGPTVLSMRDNFLPTGLVAAGSAESPETPVGPQPPTNPEYRLVAYGNAADPASWAPGVNVEPPAGASIRSVGNGAYGTARLMPDGSLSYFPDPDAADWPSDGGPIVDRILVTLSDGTTKHVEVVVVNGTAYDSAGRNDLGGEYHEGLVAGSYMLATTTHDDTFVRRTGDVGLASGSSLDMGAGDDILRIRVSGNQAFGITGSSARMGSGDDVVCINAETNDGRAYAVSGGLLDMGAGNDTLHLAGKATGTSWSGVAYTVAGGAKINLGDGNNVATIAAESASRYAYGIHSDYNVTGGARTSLSAGDNDDTLTINVRGGTIGAGVSNAVINLGNGHNRADINVRGNSGASLYGMDRAEFITGSGDDTLNITLTNAPGYGISDSTINMGEGNNLLTISGAQYSLSGRVTMGSGNDSIVIESTQGGYGLFGYSSFNMGAGNDLIRVSLSEGNSLEALSTGALDMGDGNDTVSFQATATNNAGGMNNGASLLLGKGDDLVDISATAQGWGWLAFGMHNSSRIDLGEGDDTLRIAVSAVGSRPELNAYGIASFARITAGDGNDDADLRVEALATIAGTRAEACGVTSAFVDMGAGDDKLRIEARADGGNAFAYAVHALYDQSCSVTAGDGNDTIALVAASSGTLSSAAAGVNNATLTTGNGADVVTIEVSASGVDAVAAGLQKAVVDLGDGNDLLRGSIHSDVDAYGLAQGIDGANRSGGTRLALGAGDDLMFLDIHAGRDAYGIYRSSLIAGAGDDHVVLNVDGGNAYGLHGSSVDMGSGNDVLEISTQASGRGVAVYESLIDLGTGDDTLIINGDIGGYATSIMGGKGNDVLHINGAFGGDLYTQRIDAGEDDDRIELGTKFSMSGGASLHGGTGVDVLKLDAGLGDFDFRNHTGKITGMERLDLSDGAHTITLGLNDVLALTNDASGAGRGESLRILSDGDDLIRLSGGGWSVDHTNIVTLTGADGTTRDFYTATNGSTTVYIDEQVRLDMLSITG